MLRAQTRSTLRWPAVKWSIWARLLRRTLPATAFGNPSWNPEAVACVLAYDFIRGGGPPLFFVSPQKGIVNAAL